MQLFHPLESFLFDAFELPAHDRRLETRNKTLSPNYKTTLANGVAVLEIELPGVPKDRLDLTIKEDIVDVTGVRPKRDIHAFVGVHPADITKVPENAKKEEKALGNGAQGDNEETGCVKYAAKFKLAYDVDVENIKAEFKDGLLQMKIPRRKESEPRRLVVD